MKNISQLILSMQFAFIAISTVYAQSPITKYATVSLDNQKISPILERAQKELSQREILVLVIAPSKDSSATDVYVSSIKSTAQLEENIPSLIGQFKEYPVLVYLSNPPVFMLSKRWDEVKKMLSTKLSVHTLEQFRMGIDYDPEIRQLTIKQNKIIQQRKSTAISLPGWKY